MTAKTIPLPTPAHLRADASGTPAEYRRPGLTEGELHTGRVRGVIADYRSAAQRGDVVLADQARRNLLELCGEVDSGRIVLPEWVRREMSAR